LENNTGSYVRITNQPSSSLSNYDFACLGNWNEVTYAVNGGNLERNGVPVVTNVVNLQAQYGISATANSNQITQWVDATDDWAAPGPSVADRNRIKALRIAVVAQNPQIDTSVVTTACDQATFTGLCAWQDVVAPPAPVSAVAGVDSPAPVIDLSATSDWNKYRYRVFETIIPLRNMVWAKSTL
jgi:type IV pilus assembly protein PilW